MACSRTLALLVFALFIASYVSARDLAATQLPQDTDESKELNGYDGHHGGGGHDHGHHGHHGGDSYSVEGRGGYNRGGRYPSSDNEQKDNVKPQGHGHHDGGHGDHGHGHDDHGHGHGHGHGGGDH